MFHLSTDGDIDEIDRRPREEFDPEYREPQISHDEPEPSHQPPAPSNMYELDKLYRDDKD